MTIAKSAQQGKMAKNEGDTPMTARYINPYTDFGFKRLFGEEASKDLLIDFLNAFLPEKHRVKTLDFRNPERRDKAAYHRKAVYDIFCEGENGEHFIVEMQQSKQNWFKDRALFLSTFPIRDQAVPGKDWDFQLKAVYLVAVLGFEYDKEEECRKLQRNVTLKDQDGDLFYDKLEFIFRQMPLFTKTESELDTRQDKWYYFLKNLPDFSEIPAILREPVFERAFSIARVSNMTEEELRQYEDSLMTYWDDYAVMKTAVEEGEAKGRAEVARSMKQEGLDKALIVKMTGLSEKDIDSL